MVLIVALLAVAASASAIALLPSEGSSDEPQPVASPTTTTTSPATSSTAVTATTTTAIAPAVESVTFLAAGDIGGHENPAGDVLRAMAVPQSDFFLILGDLSYEEIVPATAWCDWVQGFFPTDYPIEIVVGNHEDDKRANGFIREFTPCMPDRMDSHGRLRGRVLLRCRARSREHGRRRRLGRRSLIRLRHSPAPAETGCWPVSTMRRPPGSGRS